MNSSRESMINGYKIEEFYWAGKFVVYVNNKLSGLSFEDNCKHYQALKGNQ